MTGNLKREKRDSEKKRAVLNISVATHWCFVLGKIPTKDEMETAFKLRILLATILFNEVCCGPLQVVWMVPARSHEHTNFAYNASSSVAALALGLETIEKEGILPNHALKYVPSWRHFYS